MRRWRASWTFEISPHLFSQISQVSSNTEKIHKKFTIIASESHKTPNFRHQTRNNWTLNRLIFLRMYDYPLFGKYMPNFIEFNKYSQLENLTYHFCFPRTPKTLRRWLTCSFSLFKYQKITSINTILNDWRNGLKTPFIILMKDVGTLIKPKDITKYSYILGSNILFMVTRS